MAARALHALVDVDLAGLPWGRSRGPSAQPVRPRPAAPHPPRSGPPRPREGSEAFRPAAPRSGPSKLQKLRAEKARCSPASGAAPAGALQPPRSAPRREEAHSLLPWGPEPLTPLRLPPPTGTGPEPGLRGAAGLTLPARGADAGKALVVLGRLALATVPAGARGTRGQHHLTCGSWGKMDRW